MSSTRRARAPSTGTHSSRAGWGLGVGGSPEGEGQGVQAGLEGRRCTSPLRAWGGSVDFPIFEGHQG